MLYKCHGAYVDDIVVKSKEDRHMQMIGKVFTKCRQYNLRRNPLKFAFDVSLEKFLGFIIHKKGIDLNSTKAKPSNISIPHELETV